MSEIITNKLTGKTSAGDVTITDGSVTFKLQDGVAKAWARFDLTGTQSIDDSLSVTSIVDVAVGKTTLNFTNTFSTQYFSMGGASMGGNVLGYQDSTSTTTTSVDILTWFSSYSDNENQGVIFMGDLA